MTVWFKHSTVTPFDIIALRQAFPILRRKINGHPLAFLDSGASSQKPQRVIDCLADYYQRYNANVHRGVYTLSEEATLAYEQARAKVARFVGAASPREIIFTRNTTEAINLVARAWGDANLRMGDRILLSVMEHHSNLVPWQLLAQRTGAQLDFLQIDDMGRLALDDLEVRTSPSAPSSSRSPTNRTCLARSTRCAISQSGRTRWARCCWPMRPRACRICRWMCAT